MIATAWRRTLRALGHRCARPARPTARYRCWCGQQWRAVRNPAGPNRWVFFRANGGAR